eukprot:4577579-Amphidinium_carterae.1
MGQETDVQSIKKTSNDGAEETTPLTRKASETEQVTVIGTALRAMTLAVFYISVSAAMICFNKYLISKDRFPFATVLTTLHMVNSLTMSTLCYYFFPAMFPSAHFVFGEKGKRKELREIGVALMPFSLIALAGAVSLVSSNTAYKYSSVAFLQMVKESHIIFVYTMMVIVGLDQLRLRNCAILFFIAASAC